MSNWLPEGMQYPECVWPDTDLPTEEMVNDWNIHNDHAYGYYSEGEYAEDYDDSYEDSV